MKRYSITALAACLLAVSAVPGEAPAIEVTIGMGGGLAILTGDGNEYWNPGFTVGGTVLFPVTPRIKAGGRISYGRWGPDEEARVGDLGFPGVSWDVTGARTVVEVAPTVRFIAPVALKSPFRLFAQIGAGLYILNAEATVTASYAGRSETFADEGASEKKIGMSIGAGIGIGRFELLPLYTVVATEGASAGYYSIQAGAAFVF